MKETLEKIDQFIKQQDLIKSDVVIVGGLSLELNNIRSANDIDVILLNKNIPALRGNIFFLFPKVQLNTKTHFSVEDIDVHINRYMNIGIQDEDFLNNPEWFDTIEGYLVVKPEIELIDRVLSRPHKRLADAKQIAQTLKHNLDYDLLMSLLFKASQHMGASLK